MIYQWLNDESPRRKPGRAQLDKLDEQALLEDVRCYPDKLLREQASGSNSLVYLDASGFSHAGSRSALINRKNYSDPVMC